MLHVEEIRRICLVSRGTCSLVEVIERTHCLVKNVNSNVFTEVVNKIPFYIRVQNHYDARPGEDGLREK